MKRKPNLLFVFADQWRRDAMGFMGKDEVITPNIDSFAQESLSFDNAMSACPLCSPNRAYNVHRNISCNSRGMDKL